VTGERVDSDSRAMAVPFRVAGVGLIGCAVAALVIARPVDLRLRIEDETGRPLEAVVVRVVRSADPRWFVELYTDADGRAHASVEGVRKSVDITVNPPVSSYDPSAHTCGGPPGEPGPTYQTVRACGVGRAGYDDEIVTVTLGDRLPTRQVCRLTGRGVLNGP
jgi:hypothetical protein